MVTEGNHSCGSELHHLTTSSSSSSRQQRRKVEVYNEILRRLKDSGHHEAMQPSFNDQLWSHFNRLPTRYALDVNVERAADVLMHKRLLHLAHDPANRPSIEVRLVQETEKLKAALEREVLKKIERQVRSSRQSVSSFDEPDQAKRKNELDHLTIPNDGTDVWEIDPKHLNYGTQVASGSYGELFKGVYCSQEVAIKVLKAEHVNSELQKEFAQEVYIMRKVRHKNAVQFIGACTKPPRLCIVTEFMSGGSVYDYLHKQKGFFKFPTLLKVAIDVSKGMNYLHQHNIIHRDLKAANLLMDENCVIEHNPYDHKADVFSFGIFLWELLTGKLPYEYVTPLQAAIGVVQKGLRLTIPKNTRPKFVELLERSWQQDPTLRPDFSEIIEILQQLAKEVGDGEERHKDKSGGLLSVFRRGHH